MQEKKVKAIESSLKQKIIPGKYEDLKQSLLTDISQELSYQKISNKKINEYVE